MKINQLFSCKIDEDTLLKIVRCFGLNDLSDRRFFCKHDIARAQTVQKIQEIKCELYACYLPCKARIYLDEPMNEKRAVTILKQVLRLHEYLLVSKERNVNKKKTIFYQLIGQHEPSLKQMRKSDYNDIVSFD